MYRVLFSVIAAIVLCAPVGCRSCAHPFDYCGPTFTNGGGECGDSCGPCDPNSRAGSVLVSNGSPIPGRLVPEPAPESAPLISPERSDKKPIEESMLSSSGVQLIAETDRAMSQPIQDKTPILAPTLTPAKPSFQGQGASSQGAWTARKSKRTYR